MALLLDAGIWVAAANPGESLHHESRAVTRGTESLAGLDLTLLEVSNVIAFKWGQAGRATLVLEAIAASCDERLVRVDSETALETTAIAAEHGLTAYDAAYVAVAQRNGWTLVSTDFRDLVSKGLAVSPDAAV